MTAPPPVVVHGVPSWRWCLKPTHKVHPLLHDLSLHPINIYLKENPSSCGYFGKLFCSFFFPVLNIAGRKLVLTLGLVFI